MKTKFIFYLLIVFSFQACAVGKNPCLRKLKKEVKNSWQLSGDKKYYISGKFIYQFDSTYYECIKSGVTVQQVIKIFGEPSKPLDKENRIAYLITPPPVPPNYYSTKLFFYFDSNLKLVNTSVIYFQLDSTDN